MELAKLEIKGFKSFGEKVTILFDKGITGIVGPNGCGKSNVVDAIRWVLGEQKISTLRSEKLENIIFNGTKHRKPLQMAEASITFNNTRNILPTEYSTVTITRRYYRTGDSEYLLNGVPCRLKDISNLFLDTGIASHSYAIIELGMVDEILTDKDNARRHLFEEAAGVSKFRVRRKETFRKLEATDQDLERVEDLLFEIDKNMRSLEKQAKQTERYYRLKEEYKTASINFARVSLHSQLNSIDEIQKSIDSENDRKANLSRQVDEKEASIEKSKTELIEKEASLAEKQKSLNDFVGKIRQVESDKKIRNERLRYLHDKSENLRGQMEQDKISIERASFSIQGLQQEKQSESVILSEIEIRMKALHEEYLSEKDRENQLQEEVDAMNHLFRIKREDYFQVKKNLEIKEIQASSLKQELEKTATDSTEQSANLIQFDTKIHEVNVILDQKLSDLERARKHDEEIQTGILSAEKTIEVVREEMTELNRKLDARQNEFNLTKSLVENLEGFPEAIRFLKKQKGWGKEAPLLSDIITCEEKYRVTIENFLEPYMNYYVVENEADAYNAVNLLSEASKGRAHFFVLEAFERFYSSPLKIFRNAIPATEIVEYDSRYAKLVRYILDNVYIFSGPEQEIPADKEVIFISANGKFTRRQFSISGGSIGLFEGKKIGRAKNLEKLDKEIADLNKRIEVVRNELSKEQYDLNQLKSSVKKEYIENLQAEINHLNETLVSLRTRKEQFTEWLNNQAVKKEDISEKISQIEKELVELQPLNEAGKTEIENLQEKINNLQNELKNQHEIVLIRHNAYNQENLLFHQQQNKIHSIDQEIGFKTTALENSRERITINSDELNSNEAEIKELVDHSVLNDDELVNMYRQKEEFESTLNEAEKEYYSSRGNIDELEKKVRELQHTREQVDTLIMEWTNRLNEIRLQLSATRERLSVEFNVNLDEITKEVIPGEPETEEQLREKVNHIKEKMERLGMINPMAMEAYNEIKERFEFITAQKDDLVRAKESLVTTMDEIDLAARANFMEAFGNIKSNFARVFRNLFSEGDDCDLILLNPEDPLNSGIEIIAKPKGKRPLTINQLSGGEKTLTATSLLFAIYLLKPAPFCIFDEVDAPLDDANIDKFNNIIRTFSNESQFIIVTHNKRTMAATDIIYGITMVEEGISKVVPVDLRELEV